MAVLFPLPTVSGFKPAGLAAAVLALTALLLVQPPPVQTWAATLYVVKGSSGMASPAVSCSDRPDACWTQNAPGRVQRMNE